MLKIFYLFLMISIQSFAANSQQGEKFFLNYCAACHSLQYANPPLFSNLSPGDAVRWFGLQPPDLSLETLKYSKAWVSRYLSSFYDDRNQVFGRNNYLLENVHMPDVLAHEKQRKMIAEEIASYLEFVASPEKEVRQQIGLWVLLACSILIVLTWLVKNNK